MLSTTTKTSTNTQNSRTYHRHFPLKKNKPSIHYPSSTHQISNHSSQSTNTSLPIDQYTASTSSTANLPSNHIDTLDIPPPSSISSVSQYLLPPNLHFYLWHNKLQSYLLPHHSIILSSINVFFMRWTSSKNPRMWTLMLHLLLQVDMNCNHVIPP